MTRGCAVPCCVMSGAAIPARLRIDWEMKVLRFMDKDSTSESVVDEPMESEDAKYTRVEYERRFSFR